MILLKEDCNEIYSKFGHLSVNGASGATDLPILLWEVLK